MKTTRIVTTRDLLAALAGVTLCSTLFAAGWAVYRRLPADSAAQTFAAQTGTDATTLRIRLRLDAPGVPDPNGKVIVRIYPINMAAARSEYVSERRPGQRFEDFVTRLMGDRQPVNAELDERGETIVTIQPGRWWIHTTVGDERELSWRLPVNVTGREKQVELTPENAYARTQRF